MMEGARGRCVLMVRLTVCRRDEDPELSCSEGRRSAMDEGAAYGRKARRPKGALTLGVCAARCFWAEAGVASKGCIYSEYSEHHSLRKDVQDSQHKAHPSPSNLRAVRSRASLAPFTPSTLFAPLTSTLAYSTLYTSRAILRL